MNSKLFSASILVLGMAALSPALAYQPSIDVDNNAVALLGNASSADDGGVAVSSTELYAPKSESTSKTDNSINDSFNTKTDTDTNTTNKDSFNTASLDLYAPKSETTTKTETSTKIEDSFNSKTDNSIDNSKTATDSFNSKSSSETSSKNSFNTIAVDASKSETSTKSESSSKIDDSFNTDNSVDNSKHAKDSFNSKDSHDVTTKDSFNSKSSSETTNKDSFNSKSETNTKLSDSSTHTDVTVGDLYLTLSQDTVASKAEMTSSVSYAAVATLVGGVSANATMSDNANSNWAGLNQVSLVGGANNSTQLNQQVTAKVGTLNLN